MASLLSMTHLIVSAFLMFLLSGPATADLAFGFYASSCPNAEALVKNAVKIAAEDDPSLPGKLLRLFFHDCMVEGCDGSVLLEGNGTERSDPVSSTLGGFDAVNSAKSVLEIICPGVVSCADIVVLAARDAVELAGGPSVPVPTGRRDGRVSLESNVLPNIIDTTFTVDEMVAAFSSKGLSVDDLVVLSGGHTIGSAHCSAFSERFQQDRNGTLKPADATMDGAFAAELLRQCPAGADTRVTVSNDPESPGKFDNQYFRNLLVGKGLLGTDAALAGDKRTRGKVEEMARSGEGFLAQWGEAFVRMSSIGVKGDDEGEVRRSCRVHNE